MAFLPFFKRPDPDTKYLDRVIASVDIGNVHVSVCNRGISCEVYNEDEEEEEVEEEEED